MTIDLLKANEREFRTYVESRLWAEIDPVARLVPGEGVCEVAIGKFILDLVAPNEQGGLTIIEFKVNASKATLAQLLLYPRALEWALDRTPVVRLRVGLVTTFLDQGVVDMVDRIVLPWEIFFRLAVATPDGECRLIDPVSNVMEAPPMQYWDQVREGPRKDISRHKNGEILLKNKLVKLVCPK